MVKLAQKINLSSSLVLKTFMLLLQDDYTMQELVDKLNQQESNIIFNNSIVSKYINTCRCAGIEIPKIHNKYFVTHIPFGIEFSEIEIDLLETLKKVISESMSSKYLNIFNTFREKLNRYSDKKIAKVEKNDFQTSFAQFEQAVREKRKVKLLFKNRDILECVPIKVLEQDSKTFFKVFKNRSRLIDISRLSGIETLQEKFIPVHDNNDEIVYKLKPPMSKRYQLRPNETLLEKYSDGSIIISNKEESSEYIISRLLRYDISCEILKPNNIREEIKQILDDTLKNYGV